MAINNMRHCFLCNDEDSTQPVHPCSLIRVLVVHMKKLSILSICCPHEKTLHPNCAQGQFRSDSTNVQADLNLCCVHMCKGTFADIAAHIYLGFQI